MNKLKMSYAPDEPTPPNLFSDHIWFREHWTELLNQYGECSVVIYQQTVIGFGMTYTESLANAEANLPPDSPIITPIQEWLVIDNPLLRFQPRPTGEITPV